MDIHPRGLHCSKTDFYIGVCITHLRRDRTWEIVLVPSDPLADNGFVMEHNSILLPFIHEMYPDPFSHPFDNLFRAITTDSDNSYIDPEAPPVWTYMYGTPLFDNSLACMPMSNKYFDIFEEEIDWW